jgi:hypothetical protein
MTWEELSEAHREAAIWLMGSEGHHRAVCGRAYYSVYALVTSRLPVGTSFGRGWSNPEHVKLPEYINQLPELKPDQRRRARTAIRRLRQRREDADYRPGISVTLRDAKEAMRDVEEVRRILRR